MNSKFKSQAEVVPAAEVQEVPTSVAPAAAEPPPGPT